MRRLSTRTEEKRKSRRNQFIIGGILIVVMLFSVLGFSLQSKGSNSGKTKSNGNGTEGTIIDYNGLEFAFNGNYWILQMGSSTFGFAYNPNQVGRIAGDVSPLNNYARKPLYISSQNPDAEQEIYRNLNQIVLRSQPACLEGEECSGDYPIKTCEDNFIIIKEDVNSSIVQENNCVYIRGEYSELPKLADEFLWKILGLN